MSENKPEVRSDIDQIYSAVIADDEALEDAKMTLEVIKKTDPGVYDEIIDDSLALINYALSKPILSIVDRLADPDQEPVAWMHASATGNVYFRKKPQDEVFNPQPLYLAPPQREECCAECGKKSSDGWALYCVKCSEREWVGLTKEELQEISEFHFHGALSGREFYDDIEAKLKEKNT
jgi:hypothetical protein